MEIFQPEHADWHAVKFKSRFGRSLLSAILAPSWHPLCRCSLEREMPEIVHLSIEKFQDVCWQQHPLQNSTHSLPTTEPQCVWYLCRQGLLSRSVSPTFLAQALTVCLQQSLGVCGTCVGKDSWAEVCCQHSLHRHSQFAYNRASVFLVPVQARRSWAEWAWVLAVPHPRGWGLDPAHFSRGILWVWWADDGCVHEVKWKYRD